MELRHLRYFVAVAEELHFRRAAERLYVAQPAVSEQIRKLEAELGVQLLERTNRRVALTEAGAAMLEEARRVLAQAEVARNAARAAGLRPGLRLRLGYPASTLPGAIPRALRQLTASLPNAEIRFETGTATRLLEDVRSRRLDVAVATLPAPTGGLRVAPLGAEPAVIALPTGDPRAVEPVLSLERVAPARVVLPPRDSDPALHDTIVALCQRAGLVPTLVETSVPGLDAVLLAVAAGAGAAVLPAFAAEHSALPGVRLIELAGTEDAFETAVVTHPDTESMATLGFLRAVAQVGRRREAGAARLRLVA